VFDGRILTRDCDDASKFTFTFRACKQVARGRVPFHYKYMTRLEPSEKNVRERGGSVRMRNRSLISLGSNRDNDQGFLPTKKLLKKRSGWVR
jgi:hypothetical protein